MNRLLTTLVQAAILALPAYLAVRGVYRLLHRGEDRWDFFLESHDG